MYADIALNINNLELGKQLYTYLVPEHLNPNVFVGTQVLVSFGNQNLVSGYVVGLNDNLKYKNNGRFSPDKIKPIIDVLDNSPLFDRDYVDFLHWLADYYLASISDVINAAIPRDLGAQVKRIVSLNPNQNGIVKGNLNTIEQTIIDVLNASKTRSLSINTLKQKFKKDMKSFYSHLTRLKNANIITIESQLSKASKAKFVTYVSILNSESVTNKRHEAIILLLKDMGGQLPLAELVKQAKTSNATIEKMASIGILSLSSTEIYRDHLANVGKLTSSDKNLKLTEDQEKVLNKLKKALAEKIDTNESTDDSPWLLHGVTGSGKTEIYLQLIQEALKKNRTALMLVPEISLTPQLAQRLISRFGQSVAVWHSHLSSGERHDTMRRIKDGSIKVLLGARSAILTNMPNIGLIVLDEEHDGSYKQTSPSPRYNAKHVAIERAVRSKALVLFGSATPDVSTYYQAKQNNKVLELPNRVFKQELPKSIIVDMAEEFKAYHKGIFSRILIEKLNDGLEKKQQSILLINRRGYANYVLCQACGYTAKCRNCSVSLVYHQKNGNATIPNTSQEIKGRLSCHHCGFAKAATLICDNCQNPFLEYSGVGTQKVEQELKNLFPQSRLLRLDSDTITHRHAHEEIFKKFQAGEADILIGTQMVAKGIDIPNVSLVGVLSADSAFNLPDYRALERGFQLLTQVSGRPGRAETPGLVILQAYNTSLPALRLAQKHDYKTFFEQELEARQSFDYPPFSQMIRIVISSENDMEVEKAALEIAEHLSTFLEDKIVPENIKILGPAPCLIERVKGRYRQHIVLKNQGGDLGLKLISNFIKQSHFKYNELRVIVDIDALDLI
jgi:primosomal protein N' (replication factor Y)